MQDAPEELPVERIAADRLRGLTPRRRRIAFTIAIAADLLQCAAFPLFMSGAISAFDDVLDVIVAVALLRLIGWHWALLPAFVAEIVPFADLVPTWTVAVWLATRRRR